MKIIYSFIFMILFVGASAIAAPTKIVNRVEYSTALNSIASVAMTWYGSLIKQGELDSSTNNLPIRFNLRHSFDPINTKWSDYRSHYPSHIKKILITNTQILKQANEYHFTVDSIFSFTENNKHYSESFREVFVFNQLILKKAIGLQSPIVSVNLINSNKHPSASDVGYNREHYKVTTFIYAWLSHLDGINTLDTVLNKNAWFDSAEYSLEMDGLLSQGSVHEMLKKRSKLLAKGGHLLRSLNVKKTKENNVLILQLILEWEGENHEGIPVIAKIKQDIKILIKADKSWQIMSIKEKHLLPDIAPWMGLLC